MAYLKFWLQVLAAVLAAVIPAISDQGMGPTEWFNVIVLGAGAVMVFNAADVPGWRHAKLIASAASAVAVVLISVWPDGISVTEWMQIASALFGALGVGVVPNKAKHRYIKAAA